MDAGHDHPATQINNRDVFTTERQNLFTRADADNRATQYRDRLRPVVRIVDGVYAPVNIDGICPQYGSRDHLWGRTGYWRIVRLIRASGARK